MQACKHRVTAKVLSSRSHKESAQKDNTAEEADQAVNIVCVLIFAV